MEVWSGEGERCIHGSIWDVSGEVFLHFLLHVIGRERHEKSEMTPG